MREAVLPEHIELPALPDAKKTTNNCLPIHKHNFYKVVHEIAELLDRNLLDHVCVCYQEDWLQADVVAEKNGRKRSGESTHNCNSD